MNVNSNKELLSKVYESGLNIYALLNKFQKEMSYPMPDHIITLVCEEYLKNKPKIKNNWTWFVRVLKAKRDEAYASLQIQKAEKYKKDTNTMLLKNLFK